MKYRPESGKAVLHPRRTERQLSAAQRQEERAKRTVQQQLERIEGYAAKKERARLKENNPG